MNKGERYDNMTQNPSNDTLKFFEKYSENMAYVQERIMKLQPGRLFDLGCGTGNLAGPLSEKFDVTGIDTSSEMLDQLHKKYPRVERVQKSIDKWIQTAEFKPTDTIVSSYVLHGIQDKTSILGDLSRAAKLGCTILILDYVFDDDKAKESFIEDLNREDKSELADLIRSKHYLCIDQIEKWCSNSGLQMQCENLTHWIYLIEIHTKVEC